VALQPTAPGTDGCIWCSSSLFAALAQFHDQTQFESIKKDAEIAASSFLQEARRDLEGTLPASAESDPRHHFSPKRLDEIKRIGSSGNKELIADPCWHLRRNESLSSKVAWLWALNNLSGTNFEITLSDQYPKAAAEFCISHQ
jgi:hypothetical protein